MIRFSCPGCGATYSVDDAKGGKTGKCPKCQSQFLIPMPEGGAAPPPLPPPPPPSAASSDPNAPVEIAPCPKCDARLSVATSDLGVDVECPYCKTVYKAVKPGAGGKAPTGGRGARAAEEEEDRPSRRRRDDDADEDRPSRRGRAPVAAEDDEDRPSRRRRDDDGDEDRPSRRRRDDDEDEDRPRRRKRRRSGGGEPHRGTLILVLGILSFVGCGIFTAIPAWIMGKGDLAKMDEGTMDDEGRGITQVGMYLGMASCILTLIVFLFYCVIFLIAGIGGAAGGR